MKHRTNQFVWNVKAFFYRRLRSFFVYRRIYEAEIRPFKNWLTGEFQSKKTYLDLAVGSGDSLNIYPPGTLLMGSDFSLSMLGVLKAKTDIPLIQAEATELPFQNGAFAGITAIGLTEYISAPRKLFWELSRVLSDQGWLAITISQPNLLNLLRNFSGNRLHYYSIGFFSRLAAEYGFQILHSSKTLFQCQLFFSKIK